MKWDLKQFLSNFNESNRTFYIGDNIAITYTAPFTPIKINGTTRSELNFKSSFCIYDVWDEELKAEDYSLDVEMIAIEEYSDSPNSIYIDEKGALDTDTYHDIKTIELGNVAILYVHDDVVTHYKINSDSISKIQAYAIVRSTMNELEKMADDVQAMRDGLYKFLDEHYDFSDKELVARLKEVG